MRILIEKNFEQKNYFCLLKTRSIFLKKGNPIFPIKLRQRLPKSFSQLPINQTYISHIEDTHQILFGSANFLESYCVHIKSLRTYVHPDRRTDRQTDGNFFFVLVLSSKTYKTWTLVKRREFFFHSWDYNTFSFYILRMWWESKNLRFFLSYFLKKDDWLKAADSSLF